MNTSILDEWWGTGRLTALHPTETAYEESFLEKWFVHKEVDYRKHLPDGVPGLDAPLAVWALVQFYRASQLLVFRELGNEFVASGLEVKPASLKGAIPNVESPSSHYSVDLSFRFLPDLHRFAKIGGTSDPLLEVIEAWCEFWPLSGTRLNVSRDGLSISDRLEPILRSSCLSILYSERQKS